MTITKSLLVAALLSTFAAVSFAQGPRAPDAPQGMHHRHHQHKHQHHRVHHHHDRHHGQGAGDGR